MSRVQEIQRAIADLSLEERAELMSSLMNFEDDAWDKQMSRDAAAGKLGALNREAEQELQTGKTKVLGDLLNER